MKTVTGLLHIHTTYSYDGRSTIDDIAAVSRARGHSFVLLTEHSSGFSLQKMEALCEDSRRLSDEQFRIIPGLEVDCDFGRHLLAVGIRRCIAARKPDEVVREIADSGGLAILPHPALYQFRSFVSSAASLNGVEVWNRRYDSRYVPNPRSFALLERLRAESPTVFAYGGQDLHDRKDAGNLCLRLQLRELSDTEILSALKEGSFEIVSRTARFNARGDIGLVRRLYFDVIISLGLVYGSFSTRRSVRG